MPARLARAVFVSLVMSCAASAPPTPTPTPPTTTPDAVAASPTAAPTPLPPGAIRMTAAPERSLATIRVRETVASVALPGEAVLTTSAFSGSLVLLADGSFATGSVLTVDLDSLESDSDLRDEWIKINTLDTRRYPKAELVAKRVTGVPLPLPLTGEWAAKLESTMRVHGVDRDVTWELRVSRSASEVRAAGATLFRFGDHGMAVPANRLILSVVDEIRLAVDVVATIE